jgi:hypothetical protein
MSAQNAGVGEGVLARAQSAGARAQETNHMGHSIVRGIVSVECPCASSFPVYMQPFFVGDKTHVYAAVRIGARYIKDSRSKGAIRVEMRPCIMQTIISLPLKEKKTITTLITLCMFVAN